MLSIHLPDRPLRVWCIVVAIPLLLAVAWTDSLDDRSEAYIENALIGGATIYATARGINALVSVLQGTEIAPPFFTFSVGEVLDPINDLIERFSAVLLVALGSLAMQRLLLELASHTLFNVLVTGMGIATMVMLVWGRRGAYRTFIRFFLVTIVLRFTLAIVVVVNGAIDAVFFQEPEAASLREMQAFESRLKLASAQAQINASVTGDIEATEQLLQESRRALGQARLALTEKQGDISTARAELEKMPQPPVWQPWAEDSAQVKAQKALIAQLEESAAAIETDVEHRLTELEAAEDKLECLRLRAEGKTCNWLDSIRQTSSIFDIQRQMDEVSQDINAFVDNTIRLLVSLLVRSVLLPLLLLLLAVHWCRRAVKTEL